MLSNIINVNNSRAITNQNVIVQEEEEMSDQFMTSDELISFINENQHLENVNITIDDLTGIDLLNFIEFNYINIERAKKLSLRNMLDRYRNDQFYKFLDPFAAYELKINESTDKEYSMFKDELFSKVRIKGKYLLVDEFNVEHYDFIYEGNNERVRIGRTKNFETTDITLNNAKIHCVTYVLDSSGFTNWAPIYYSKNAKYFILGSLSNTFGYEFMKVFFEIDD
jgi:hypothetical protein